MKQHTKISSVISILILLFLATAFSIAQKKNSVVKIKLEKTSILYLGIDNPVLITVPNVNPEDITVLVNDGWNYFSSYRGKRLRRNHPYDSRDVCNGSIILPLLFFSDNLFGCIEQCQIFSESNPGATCCPSGRWPYTSSYVYLQKSEFGNSFARDFT